MRIDLCITIFIMSRSFRVLHHERRGGRTREMQDPSEIIDVIATIVPGLKMKYTTDQALPWIRFSSKQSF